MLVCVVQIFYLFCGYRVWPRCLVSFMFPIISCNSGKAMFIVFPCEAPGARIGSRGARSLLSGVAHCSFARQSAIASAFFPHGTLFPSLSSGFEWLGTKCFRLQRRSVQPSLVPCSSRICLSPYARLSFLAAFVTSFRGGGLAPWRSLPCPEILASVLLVHMAVPRSMVFLMMRPCLQV